MLTYLLPFVLFAEEAPVPPTAAGAEGVERLLEILVQVLVPFIEICGAFIIVFGVARAILRYLRGIIKKDEDTDEYVRLDLGRSLILALEFQVGADILKTALAPTWASIGQLGSIIVLRTVLNYFLTRELDEIKHHPHLATTDPSVKPAVHHAPSGD